MARWPGAGWTADLPLFRRSGLPVRAIRSKRGWMLLCVHGGGWLAPLLSPLPSSLRVQHAYSCAGVRGPLRIILAPPGISARPLSDLRHGLTGPVTAARPGTGSVDWRNARSYFRWRPCSAGCQLPCRPGTARDPGPGRGAAASLRSGLRRGHHWHGRGGGPGGSFLPWMPTSRSARPGSTPRH
jgi:hypothetical protein